MLRLNNLSKRTVSMLLAAATVASAFPVVASAAQEHGYRDPAANWLQAMNRANELESNSVEAHSTDWCNVCEKETTFQSFRVPEYTTNGQTAKTRNVGYSDGTLADGSGTGDLMAGIPGKNATYTGYHWTKSMCETCGSINSNMPTTDYGYCKNVYWLYSCDANFMQDLGETITYEEVDDTYHMMTTTTGEYCGFCYGTNSTESSELVKHNMEASILPQPGNGRFAVIEKCTDCGYTAYDYVAAKSVIASYYGEADGNPHTITINDLSDSGVSTEIRYGNSADNCTLTSAPNYTEKGQYSVYYQITYTYQGKTMTENGVANVWLSEAETECEHEWKTYTIREATCEEDGLVLEVCTRCGELKETATPKNGHKYEISTVDAACTSPGYTVKECSVCGDRHITHITNALGHDYASKVTEPTCTKMGYTTYTCTRCGDSYHSDYTEAIGHKPGDWIVDQEPTTDSEGSKHKECENCGETLETQPIEKIYKQDTTNGKGQAVVGGYLVIVTDADTKNPVANATVTLNQDNSISIRLPDGRLLDYEDQTTVTVQLKKDNSAVPDLSIAVTDKNENYASGKTDAAGQITVPTGSGKTNADGKITAGYEDADGNRWTLTVKVEHTDTGRGIPDAQVSIGKTGNITVVLPDGTDLDQNHRITVTVTDNKQKPQKGLNVIVKNDLGNSARGETDKNGKVIVPAVERTARHSAYVVGYPDGTFGAQRSMTRSEAATVFAKLLAEKYGDTLSPVSNTKFSDIPANSWYSGYVKYLTDNGVISGRTKTTFAPDEPITRGEFTTLAVRFFDVYGDGDAELMEAYKSFDDVSDGYWAAKYIKAAAQYGWITGYEDGSFRAEQEITRAEVVTIVNRLLGREADTDYIGKYLGRLNTFTDLDSSYWAYGDILEAANSHIAIFGDAESWKR